MGKLPSLSRTLNIIHLLLELTSLSIHVYSLRKSWYHKTMTSVFSRLKFIALKPWNKFKQISFKKKLLIVVLLIVALAVAGQIIGNLTKKPAYTLAKVEIGNVTEIVTETGSVAASGVVQVYSPTNGVIENVLVVNGQQVSDKDELFSVISSATEQEVQAARSNYLTAVSTLGTAEANLHTMQSAMFTEWDTYKNLAENSTYENDDGTPKTDNRTLPEFHIAEKDWLAAEGKYKNQQSVVAQAQAQVSSTWQLLQATQNAKVTAPTAGTITNLSVSNGSTVAINSTLAPTTPVLTITNASATEVSIALSETDINKVKEGQKASVKIEAAKEEDYTGIVKRVDTIGTDTQGVIRYNVYIEILNADANIKPGMTADATITTNELSDVLTVPNSAVKPYQGGRAVRVPGKNGEIEYIPVMIGIRGEEKTQIIKGLTENQEIITSLSNEAIQRSGGFFGG